MHHREDDLPVDDGVRLFHQSWLPETAPRADLLFVHGFTEHSSRHARLVEPLVERGLAVHAFDLRGHGRSSGDRVWVERFSRYADDFDRIWTTIRDSARSATLEETGSPRRAPRPCFAMGFSIGGVIVGQWAIRYQRDAAGLVLIAPAVSVGRNVFPWLRRIANLASRWLPRLRLVRLGCANISSDPAVVEQFRHDPLVFHGRFPTRSGAEILRAGEELLANASQLRQPLLILQGGGDRVVEPAAAEQLGQAAGSADKTVRLYPGLFHEVHSEPSADRVLADLLDWIESHMRAARDRPPPRT